MKREALLQAQADARGAAARAQLILSKFASWINCVTIPDPAPFAPSSHIELEEENFLTLTTLLENPGKMMEGKVLICKTLSPAHKNLSNCTVVEDSVGAQAVPLTLFNFCPQVSPPQLELEEILPIGSYLAVRNPWLTFNADDPRPSEIAHSLRVDNPADVELLSENWIKGHFPNWGAAPSVPETLLTSSLSFPAHFWTRIPFPVQKRAVALKLLGNRAYYRQNFVPALRWYDLSLEYEMAGLTLSNKAAALMGLQCWNAALKCLEKAIALGLERNEKVVKRKGKCLAGLGKYGEAIEWLEDKIQLPAFKEHKDLKNLLDDVRRMKTLSRDPLTLNSLLWQLTYDNDIRTIQSDFLPEFRGPIALAPIPGKGRGMIAEEDLKPGQLILLSKTFAVAEQEIPSFVSHHGGGRLVLFDELVSAVANKVHLDPTLAPKLYALTAGNELGHLEEDSGFEGVDILRIQGIVRNNALPITTDGKLSSEDPSLRPRKRNVLSLPMAFFNWCCVEANCALYICAAEGLEFVRVMEPVKKGTELILNFMTAERDYETRKSVYDYTDCSCSCPLCLSQAVEDPELKKKREEFLSKLRRYGAAGRVGRPAGEFESFLQDLDALEQAFAHDPFKSFLLADEIMEVVVEGLAVGRRYGEAVDLVVKIYEATEATRTYHLRKYAALLIIRYSMEAGDAATVRLWLPKFCGIWLDYFGSMEDLKILCPDILTGLKEKFDIELL